MHLKHDYIHVVSVYTLKIYKLKKNAILHTSKLSRKTNYTKKLSDTPSHDNGFPRGEDTVGVATRQMPHPHQHRHCC